MITLGKEGTVKKLCGMAALLTCSWVLWQTIWLQGTMSNVPFDAYETKAQCDDALTGEYQH